MASSWRYGKRKYRAKVSQDPEDFYSLNPKKCAAENAFDIYTALCCRDTRDTKRLFLLNGLATLCQQQQEQVQSTQQQQQQKQQSSRSNIGFTTEELLYCLSASLIHTFSQVRAAALRTMRYALNTPKDIKIFNAMQLQHLLCRSIDIMLKNDDERVQALKLIRKMLAISPGDISPVVVRCLVSLADTGMEENDNMLRVCLATLCEFAVLNPTLLVVCGGVTCITRNVLECHNPRIAESLCGVLLYLLEWPYTRSISGVGLDCLAAPYCDFTYRLGIMDKNKDAKELRYTSCRLALLSVLRSWAGTLDFCDPSKPSGLKAIVDALYLQQVEVRKAILELIYELLNVPLPIWTNDYNVALQAVDPSEFQDAWLLSNGFIAMEGKSILPSLAARAPNICEQHQALLLYCFQETGLLNALVEVVVTSDDHISVRATVLLGKVLHLMHTHLPADICSSSPALPALVNYATKGNSHATAAISALQGYQRLLRNRPASSSLFLDSIIQGGALIHTRLFRRDLSTQDQMYTGIGHTPPVAGSFTIGTLDRPRLDSVSSDDSQSSSSRRSSFRLRRRFLPFLENLRVVRLIKDSNVLSVSDGNSWDWDIVTTILRSNLIRKLDDASGKFLKQLVNFFKPSSNRFSHQELTPGRSLPSYVITGLDLIDWLLASNELESMRLLTDFFSDISLHLLAVNSSSRAHDCLFSPQHMNNTMCQQYFLFIGRMCRCSKGISILTNVTIFDRLETLVGNTDHVCYIKLIVSGLDYSLESVTRKVLEKALTSAKMRSGRLYATQFLLVLLRARIPNFEVWGIPMIIRQTRDPDRAVVLAAIDVLEEAAHEKNYLEEIVSIWFNLKGLGDVGRLLMARYYSLSRGLNHEKAKIIDEITYWKNGYNKRYVLLVEGNTHSSLTLHVRNEDGYYSRRNCNTRPAITPPNIPPHLYGQMVQTAQGTGALRDHGDLPHLIDVLSLGKCADDAECLELKAAIWAISHASTHSNGIDYFIKSGARVYEKLIVLATNCDTYSVRATCFNALGLIGGTNEGANILHKLNWLSVRHDRNTMWPVYQPEDWMSFNFTPVRHQCEDVPPYNYIGVEDQIDGSYYTGSVWNLLLSSSSTTKEGAASGSSEVQDVNITVESVKTIEETSTKPPVNVAAKSRTLPEGTYSRYPKHQRSLSESKTTDVLSLIGGPGQHHRVRYNSCTDSNTSGVSSCESVTGRNYTAGGIAGEFQQFPLSPIPSMSNLLEVPAQGSLLRRSSISGTSYVRKTMSPADIRGYAQLRSLRRHNRPVLSESATDFYDFVDPSSLKSSTSFRTRNSSFGESQRRLKVRSLDRNSSLRMYTQLDVEELQAPMSATLTGATPKLFSQNDSKGPCYAGICLPKSLLDIFPTRSSARTYVSQDIQDQDLMDINLLTAKQQLLNDSLNNEGGDESSVISSLSDVSSVSKRSRWLGAKHGRSSCLSCSRLRRNRNHASQGAESVDLHAALMTSGVQAAASATVLRKLTTKQQQQQQQQQAQQPAVQQQQIPDISFNSPESILSEESMPDRVTANILYTVQRLANPVSAKQSKMVLLEIRQKHPNSFQDICLYSEICKLLGSTSYRMGARRFLQELFLDLDFNSFYAEPDEIISKKDKNFITLQSRKDLFSVEKHLTEANKQSSSSGDKSIERKREIAGETESRISIHSHAHNYTQMYASHSTHPSHSIHPSHVSQPIHSTAPKSFNVTAVVTNTTTTTNYVGSHKSHIKSQPLASVYEASCENLLQEQSPSMQRTNETEKIAAISSNPLTETTSTTTLTSTSTTTCSSSTLTSTSKSALTATATSISTATSFSTLTSTKTTKRNTSLTNPAAVVDKPTKDNPPTKTILSNLNPTVETNVIRPSEEVSDTTTLWISEGEKAEDVDEVDGAAGRQPATFKTFELKTHSHPSGLSSHSEKLSQNTTASSTQSSVKLENENRRYRRGRFWTLELDLSCTKNKFPIRDRNRTYKMENSSEGEESLKSPDSTDELSIHHRKSWRHSEPSASSSTGTGTNLKPWLEEKSEPCNESKTSEADRTLTITKSLAASLAKPIGSLYCELRLQSCKSEAVLTNVPPTTTFTNRGRVGVGLNVMPRAEIAVSSEKTSKINTPAVSINKQL